MSTKRKIGLLVGALLLLPMLSTMVFASPTPQTGQNLIRNSGFEGGWHWQGDSYLGKIPDDWTAWWVDEATGKADDDPTFWRNQRPEYGLIGLEYHIPEQIHSGAQSLQYGKRFATHTAGVYQQVSGLTPGSTLQFTAWGSMYGKDSDPNKRMTGYMKIGIDPTGGTNVFAPSVVWGGTTSPIFMNDESGNWSQMSAETVVQNSTVTVFVYSTQDWPMDAAVTSQWDDCALVVTGQAEEATGTPPPPPPTSAPVGPPPPPAATATPSPDGSIIHTVQSGDTLWSIAIQYSSASTPPDQLLTKIKQLNNDPQLIYSGQQLVIAVPTGGVPAAPAPSEAESAPPAAAESEEAVAAAAQPEAPAPAPAQASTNSTLCVLAYHDRNVDGMRDPATEEMLPDANFTLSSEGGVVGSYTSDGANEPYCFNQLVPGTYMVQLTKPGGYNTTTPEYWAVALTGGATASVEFGHQRDPNAPVTSAQAPGSGSAKTNPLESALASASEKAESNQDKSDSKSLLSRLGEIAIGVSGIFVLLLAGAVGVAFVASRRRA